MKKMLGNYIMFKKNCNFAAIKYFDMEKNIVVPLNGKYRQFIDNEVKSGKYHSSTAVLEAALELFEVEETRLCTLRNELETGETSPMIDDFDTDKFLKSIHKKHLP
jgi:antitoxin ParD1/3/4